jgi:hypothetical protein
MSNLTPEEAAHILEYYSGRGYQRTSRNHGDAAIEDATALGAAALRFQEKYRWRRLSEEKPPQIGWYLSYSESRTIVMHYWLGTKFNSLAHITHWAYIDPPEEEEES